MHITNNGNYYAVIFTSIRIKDNSIDYINMSIKINELAKKQSGFIGMDSVRENLGITVSYWESLDAIKEFKAVWDHQLAQKLGKEKWYSSYSVRICQVLREYSFHKEL